MNRAAQAPYASDEGVLSDDVVVFVQQILIIAPTGRGQPVLVSPDLGTTKLVPAVRCETALPLGVRWSRRRGSSPYSRRSVETWASVVQVHMSPYSLRRVNDGF